MRDAEDGFPELRLLRVFVSLGLGLGALLERHALCSRARHHPGRAPAAQALRLLAVAVLLGSFRLHTFLHKAPTFSRNQTPACSLKLKTQRPSNSDVGAVVVEMVRAALLPVVELAGVDDDLPLGVHRHLGAIHRARRGAFEVDALTVVAAAVARALELVLARLPVGRASQVRAARVDDEQALGVSDDPDAVLLLPLGVHAERVVARKADAEDARRLHD